MTVTIHEEKNCAWCEVNGRFIYGRTVGEISDILEKMGFECRQDT